MGDEIAVGIGHAGFNPDGEVSRLAFPGLAKPLLAGLKCSKRVGNADGSNDDGKRAEHADQQFFLHLPSRAGLTGWAQWSPLVVGFVSGKTLKFTDGPTVPVPLAS